MSSVTDVLNKLKQLPQGRLSQLIVVLLLVYIASILANITWMVLDGENGAASALMSPKQQANNAGLSVGLSAGQSVSINSITSLNLFGDHQAVIVDDTPALPEVTEAPETQLNVKLSATVANNLEGKGSAIIESAGDQGTYEVGDKIKATTAIVHQVFMDRVILQNGNRHETLMLDGMDYNAQPEDNNNAQSSNGQRNDPRNMPRKEQRRARQDQRSDSPARAPQKRATVDKRKDIKLSRQLNKQRRDILKDPAKLMDLIRVSPVRKNGELTGYRLNPSSDPTLFKEAGLRANDLAVEINGFALNDMQQAMSALQALREVDEANIVVERDGERTEIVFSLKGNSNPDEAQRRRADPDPRANGGKLN
ncbi:MAG: general secretion pathway protein C [Phenylobacterium sp.]